MIIVSDTTPLHYLILIRHTELLPNLFGAILIPEAVFAEMSHDKTPTAVLDLMKNLPPWIQVKTPAYVTTESIKGLGKGETEAIALAIEEKADAVLMDDKKAIREARSNGLVVITTLGLLELAAIKGLVDFPKVLHELALTSFRLPPEEITEEFLKRDWARKQNENQ